MKINYTYYNNYELLDKVIRHYEPFKNDPNFTFTIIDDGSQQQPLTRGIVPDWWHLIRVKEDLGWGNEICKNILMRHTDTVWNALLDLDYVIDLHDPVCYDAITTHFKKYYKDFAKVNCCFQFMEGTRVEYTNFNNPEEKLPNGFYSINSYVVSRDAFLKTHGYDMAFRYTYGYDFTYFKQLDYEFRIPDTRLIKIAQQATTGGSRPPPGDKSAFSEFHKLEKQYIEERVYSIKNGWINENERLKRCVPMPDIEIL